MNIAEYHKMHALERHYWWFQGRRHLILEMLEDALRQHLSRDGKPIMLDIGCGTGLLLEDLRRMGTAAGLDFSTVALEYCQARDIDNLSRADVRHLPVTSNSVDVLTALDLVEHIKDDVGLMGEFCRVLRPGGIAVMSVPAHKYLWSRHDLALHHFRRYSKEEFLQLVMDSGLTPLRYSYSIAVAYLPAVVFRTAKALLSRGDAQPTTDEFRLPKPLNAALLSAVKLETRWLRRYNLPFGLSLLCIAQKPTVERS